MKTLPALFWSYYLTLYEGVTPRQSDWDGGKVVKGLKKKPINGYLNWKVGGRWRDFTTENIEEFVEPLLNAIGRKLASITKGPISIVPIPNSNMAVGEKGKFRILTLAEYLADGFGDDAEVVPAIRWDKPRAPAHESGEFRHPDVYQPHMRLVKKPASPVVIFDDVRTTGSQMIAATRFLLEHECKVIRAVSVACATQEQKVKMFGWQEDELPIARTVIDFDEF